MTALDEVVWVELGVRARAIRRLSSTLDVFGTHFPRFPVFPGVLVLDDMIEVARLAVGRSWALAEVSRVRYRGYARPGDELEIEAEVVSVGDDSAYCRAVVRIGAVQIATAREIVLRSVTP
nr:hotdog domain-containing protein [Kibdelosporangium sp. MJ126-NF4]CEL17433.1 3-hydroxyacyl-[acyl-carrier-protein] dehydratase, FabZ form [Kibdelosporangium sp. MJ126-NF4]CTQ91340.1 3-hydroxyacyl-[acyl-carrier-protein] dehydratase, FabZ form (EC 4.2.1.59) [Kibdelosporangium sp. MJ126-NF4]